MNRFALEEFQLIKGNTLFYKLKVNGACPFDEFWKEIEHEGNLAKQLKSAVTIMERVSRNLPTPANKYKPISDRHSLVKEYEVKTKDLRIYLFRDRNGAIVVSGGKKSTQKQDITRFKNLANEYINSRP